MTYYILYTENQELVGVTNEDTWVSIPGISVKQVNEPVPDLNKSVWNPAYLRFDHVTSLLTTLEFFNRFTSAERIAIRASTDPMVTDYAEMWKLADYIDVGDQTTIDGVNYLANQNLITAGRVAEILI